jgi:hypothetical protein
MIVIEMIQGKAVCIENMLPGGQSREHNWIPEADKRNIVESIDSWINSVIQEYCVSVGLHIHCKMIHGPYNIKFLQEIPRVVSQVPPVRFKLFTAIHHSKLRRFNKIASVW